MFDEFCTSGFINARDLTQAICCTTFSPNANGFAPDQASGMVSTDAKYAFNPTGKRIGDKIVIGMRRSQIVIHQAGAQSIDESGIGIGIL